MNKVCVLFAAYNGEKYISEQLESILVQYECEIDIYISLDVSSDKSIYIIKDYCSKYDNVKIVSRNKKFGSAGQNFFHLLDIVDFSKYDYVSFSDQDDIWEANKIIRALNILEEKEIDGYSSNVEAFWADGRKKNIIKSHKQVSYDYLFESSGPGCTFVLTRSLANEIKYSLQDNRPGVDKLWLHDWYCYAFARSRGYSWVIDEQSMMKYRQHEDNSVGANSGFSSLFNRAQSVIGGEAFDKVLEQSDFLSLREALPIKLLRKNSFFSLFKLAFLAKECRRKRFDQFIFFFAMIICAVKRVRK